MIGIIHPTSVHFIVLHNTGREITGGNTHCQNIIFNHKAKIDIFTKDSIQMTILKASHIAKRGL